MGFSSFSNLDFYIQPRKCPIFLGSTIKFSIGPILTFALSLYAFRWQEQAKQNKETLAVRTMLKIEIDYNLNRIKSLIKEFELIVEVLPPDQVKVPFPASIIVSVTCGHFQGSSLEPSV